MRSVTTNHWTLISLIKKETVISLVCYAYFMLFLYAACSKLLSYEETTIQLSKSPIITDFAFILVWLVPTIEIVIAILLMIRKTMVLALFAALALMSLFTAYIIAILNFSDTIPCSCGGVLQELDWKDHLVFNLVFIAMVIIAIVLQAGIEEKTRLKSRQKNI